jgi:putative toxin-antitoxin system antitoxin component (TIGR02293 family)
VTEPIKNQSDNAGDVIVPYSYTKLESWSSILSEWLLQVAERIRAGNTDVVSCEHNQQIAAEQCESTKASDLTNLDYDIIQKMESGMDSALVDLTNAGLSPDFAEQIIRQRLISREEFHAIVIKQRTYSHRCTNCQRLTSEETDRMLRLLRLKAYCADFFGSLEKADEWLRACNDGFNGKKPIDLLQTESGSRLVEQTLERIAWGVIA